jgi:hypothetical protein
LRAYRVCEDIAEPAGRCHPLQLLHIALLIHLRFVEPDRTAARRQQLSGLYYAQQQ